MVNTSQNQKLLYQVVRDHFKIVTDPKKACIFIPLLEISRDPDGVKKLLPNMLADLPYWNNGENHLITWESDLPRPKWDTGKAIIMAGSLTKRTFRHSYDLMMPILPPSSLSATYDMTTRDLLLFFTGSIYQYGNCADRGRHMKILSPTIHEPDIIFNTLCSRPVVLWPKTDFSLPQFPDECRSCAEDLKRAPGKKQYCRAGNSTWPIIGYQEGLRRAKFGWAPLGCGPLSYRLMEIIINGGIPVQTGDEAILPFEGDDTEVSRAWKQCVMFPAETALPHLVQGLRKMTRKDYIDKVFACNTIARSNIHIKYDYFWIGLCNLSARIRDKFLGVDIQRECGEILDRYRF